MDYPSFIYNGRPLSLKNELIEEFVFEANGRGGKNRTHTSGFGDRCTTTIRHPYDAFLFYPKVLIMTRFTIIEICLH